MLTMRVEHWSDLVWDPVWTSGSVQHNTWGERTRSHLGESSHSCNITSYIQDYWLHTGLLVTCYWLLWPGFIE